ncbi:MAG: type III-B CRISPR-associated protein Cas10/Cmr2 [Desulfobulbaceae bacterium]|nr:type III-B CRISPR-associated protein Cas10/Cmr2 [Desulfobulbaceae bacterium]
MTNNKKTIQFSFGPVQGFIAQARRTRDLWAGSYLLSWLAGKAMAGVIREGGAIMMPDVSNDQLLKAIMLEGKDISSKHPACYLGSLPTRFTAEVPTGFKYEQCTKTIKGSWLSITNAVKNLLNKHIEINDKLWTRQTENFWECNWVIGEDPSLLDQRKNFRIPVKLDEPGEKCTVCGERQELSCKPNSNRTVINDWWKNNIHPLAKKDVIHGLDIRQNERLCAVCITKRLFPHVSLEVMGWQVPSNYQSTAYMSAIDWLKNMLRLSAKKDNEVEKCANAFFSLIDSRILQKAEYKTIIKGVEEAVAGSPIKSRGSVTFADLDGTVFYASSYNKNELELTQPKDTLRALTSLQKAIRKCDPAHGEPSPFYALLLMDGDSMGKLIKHADEEQRMNISKALAEFTGQVNGIVHNMDGRLIYAGGDDVFALLPVDNALECARLCKIVYGKAFNDYASFIPQDKPATISAAIQYAHMTTPLSAVVHDAHSLLSDVAKARCGRNALACRVWKRGGPILTWSAPWDKIAGGMLVDRVKEAFSNKEGDPDKFSSKFFYKLREFFETVSSFDEEQVRDLLIAEYLANREHVWDGDLTEDEKRDIVASRMDKLLQLCRVWKVDQYGKLSGKPYELDEAGPLLVRFLVQKEV